MCMFMCVCVCVGACSLPVYRSNIIADNDK